VRNEGYKDSGYCIHCSEREAFRLACVYANDETERVKVTLELPAIGDLVYATREELFALALFLQDTNSKVTMLPLKAA
jgi:hypothetical protein